MFLNASAGHEGGHDVGGVPVRGPARTVVAHRRSRIRMRRRLLHIRRATPASSAAVMKECRSECGPIRLSIPARFANRRTTRDEAWRSSRRVPSWFKNNGPSVRSPIAKSTARAVRAASGMVTTLPPFRSTVRVRCPRCNPRSSMSAPRASEMGSSLRASGTAAHGPGRRRGRPEPTMLPTHCDPTQPRSTRNSAWAVGCVRPGSGRSTALARRTHRTC